MDFEKPKIVYPVIAVHNKFTFDVDGYYSNDKTFFIPTDNLYLLAILNSSTAFLFFRSELSALRGGFFEYRAQTLVHTPIRRINFTTPPNDRASYLEKAKNLYEHAMSQDNQAPILSFVEHHLSKEPEESDVVHDMLAFLAEETIRLNKEKRGAQKEFLDWLVTTLKILPDRDGRKGIDVLTGKSRLVDYPGDYQKGEPPLEFEELLEILRKNRGRLGVSLSDAGLVERMRGMYEGSLQRVLPLKKRLRRTDRLIDAVVYRLYGLTEEEVRVVEGRG